MILSTLWQKPETELSFVTRAVAGAASRTRTVSVITPRPPGSIEADGAFDLLGIGEGPNGAWPDVSRAWWARPLTPVLSGFSTNGTNGTRTAHPLRRAMFGVFH